jgi:hypothetical protein
VLATTVVAVAGGVVVGRSSGGLVQGLRLVQHSKQPSWHLKTKITETQERTRWQNQVLLRKARQGKQE